MVYHGEEAQSRKSSSLAKNIGRIVFLIVLIVCGVLLFQYRDVLSSRISKVLASTEENPVPVAKLERQPFLVTVPATGEIVGMETKSIETPDLPPEA